MTLFEYEEHLSRLMVPEVVSTLGSIREYRGKQDAYAALRPDVLASLVDVARVQSVGSSNRIEHIATSDNRLRELVAGETVPRTRDEREIAGYRFVLSMIHEQHDDIPVTPSIILQLHRDLYRFEDVTFAGSWKDADNVIAERTGEGALAVRFRPLSAVATPHVVDRLCEEYNRCIAEDAYDSLLVSLLFVFDFVSIHPFNDGNGRMSRLLTLLLLYRNGYTVGKYVSIEREIERSKETYYEALAASSIGWEKGTGDYLPFVSYLLGVIASCYRELDQRIGLFESSKGNEALLRAYFERVVGSVTKRTIMDDNPEMSQRTVERVLQKMQREGAIERVGAARATKYRKRG